MKGTRCLPALGLAPATLAGTLKCHWDNPFDILENTFLCRHGFSYSIKGNQTTIALGKVEGFRESIERQTL